MFKRSAWFDQTIGQSHLQRFFSLHAASSQDHIERVALSDQTRQTDGAEINQGNTEAAGENAKHSIAGGNPEGAPQNGFQAARACVSFPPGGKWFPRRRTVRLPL